MDLNGFKKIYIYLSLFKSSSYTCMIFCLYSVIFRVVMGPQVILLRTRVFIHNHIQTAIYIQMNVQSGSIPIFFAPSIWVLVAAQTDLCMKYAIFCVASRPDLCHLCNICCVANRNMQKIPFFHQFFTATQWVSVTSKIRDQVVNARTTLHTPNTNQPMVPPIFECLIGVENMEIGQGRAAHT